VHGQTYAAGMADTTQPNYDATELAPIVALDVTPGPVPSANAPFLVWKYLQSIITFSQLRFVRVAFFDPAQNEVSDPGPELQILPAGEDQKNPSGQVRYLLSNLPFPRQGGTLELWVYASLAGGNAAALFRVAKIPAGTREFAIELPETLIALGPSLSFRQAAPPRCDVVAAQGSRVFYGAPEEQPDAVYYSRPGQPVAIDFGTISSPVGFFRLNGGRGENITALIPLDGSMVVAKRRSLASVVIDSANLPVVRVINGGVGVVGPQAYVDLDDKLFFLSDRGMQYAARSGVTDLARPRWAGERISRFFTETLDVREVGRASMAVNRRRNQVIFVAQGVGESEPRHRVAFEINEDEEITRYGRFEDPNLTVIATVARSGGGVDEVIGGTAEGFVVWLDRRDTALCMLGFEQASFGWPVLTVDAAPDTNIGLSVDDGTLRVDSSLEGPRGAMLRWKDANGQLLQVTLLGQDSGDLLFAEAILPTERALLNADVTVGSPLFTWETPWLGLADFERLKEVEFIDFWFERRASGIVEIELLTDYSDTVKAHRTFDLSKPPPYQMFEASQVQGNLFKLRVRNPDLTPYQAFELVDIVWRPADMGQES
jgi:hypothetical protein